jgi:hypothetical protein
MSNKTWIIELEVDQGWFAAIDKLTNDIYDGEVCTWLSVKEKVNA